MFEVKPVFLQSMFAGKYAFVKGMWHSWYLLYIIK